MLVLTDVLTILTVHVGRCIEIINETRGGIDDVFREIVTWGANLGPGLKHEVNK